MAVPWLQIVRLVPSILDVSRELLKKTRRMPVAADGEAVADTDVPMRLAALEENERRQAELISQMAEQNAGLARAVTALHARLIRFSVAAGAAVVLAIAALIVAINT